MTTEKATNQTQPKPRSQKGRDTSNLDSPAALLSVSVNAPGNESEAASLKRKFIGEDLVDWIDDSHVEGAVLEPNDDRDEEMHATTEASSPEAEETAAATSLEYSQETSRYHQARRAFGLDCRCLQTHVDVDICGEYNEFVRSLASRGIAPELIAMTVPPSNNKSKSSVGIQVFALDRFLQNDVSSKSLSFASDPCETHSRSLTVPKALSAKYSWKILGEMVNAMVMERRSLCSSSQTGDAFEVTLVTTDLALFCDTNQDSHRTAVAAFLDRVAPFVRDKGVESISIVMAETGRLGLLPSSHDMMTTSDDESDLEEMSSSFRTNQLRAMTACVHAIQHEIRAKTQTLYHDDNAIPRLVEGLNVQFAVIDHCSTGYKLLSREIARISFAGRRSMQVRLTLELPELLDGTQCTASFDACHQIMPVAFNSEVSQRLWDDLKSLSRCSLELIQAMPHDSIDMSLVFGLPLKLTAASFPDFTHTREMQVLTHALFHYLEKEGVAFLLSASPSGECSREDKGLFDNKKRTFLLMPQTGADKETHSAIMFGYAQADDLFMEASLGKQLVTASADEGSPYAEYIERALDVVKVGAHNPLEHSRLEYSSQRTKLKSNDDLIILSPVSDTHDSDESYGLPAARNEMDDDNDDAVTIFDD